MPARLATPDEVCALSPKEFADIKPEFIQLWLDVTAGQINISQWGLKASVGHALLAAHALTVSEGKERGPINQMSIDKLSVVHAAVGTATQLDANYSTTKWGRLFLACRASLIVIGIVGRRTLRRPPGC